MRILILGGAGYLGGALAHHLKQGDSGHEVYVLDPAAQKVPIFRSLRVGFIMGTTLQTCLERPTLIDTFQVVINLTGGMSEDACMGIGYQFNEIALSTKYVLAAAPQVKLVHISTYHVYKEASLNKEVSEAKPCSDYGLAHVMAEIGAQKQAVVLRMGAVWGQAWPDHAYVENNGWADRLIHSDDKVVKFPEAVICLLHVENAVRAIEWAMMQEEPKIYNTADYVGKRSDAATAILGPDEKFTKMEHDPIISVGMATQRIRKAGFEFNDSHYVL